jgi:hypothetical protein
MVPVLEYGNTCWNPYREGQINASDRVQNKAAIFVHNRSGSSWKTLAERGKIVGIYLLFIDYMKERAFEGYS